MQQIAVPVFMLFVLFAGTQIRGQAVSVKSLSWMAGCWEVTDNGRVTIERWAAPTENLMIGTSQTVKGTKSVAFEFLRVVASAQGLTYVALPSSAKEPTSFQSIRSSDNEIVFENLKHDFPQRIIYRRTSSDSLFARIEGPGKDGSIAGMDIPMKRVKCE